MNKTTIQEALAALQKSSRRLKKKIGELERTRQDATAFRIKLEAIGQPKYTDDAALIEQSLLERKLKGAEEAAAALEAELLAHGGTGARAIGAAEEFRKDVIAAGCVAFSVLREFYDRRITMITAVMEQFFDTPERAKHAAKGSDSATRALTSFTTLNQLDSANSHANALRDPVNNPRALEIAAHIESILEESLTKAPDYLKFFRAAKSTATPGPVPEGLAAVSEKAPTDASAVASPSSGAS